MRVEYNIFAEGECEEDDVFTMALPGETSRHIYIKRKCPVCSEVMWIRLGFNVCDGCVP